MATAGNSEPQRLKYVPFSSAIEAPFWVRYNREKLERIQLSEKAIALTGSYGVNTGGGGDPRFQVYENSLALTEDTGLIPNERVQSRGVLLGCNTVESFQKLDKNALLQQHFLPDFTSQDNSTAITALTRFVLLTFADLKNHKVIYWFAYPVLLTTTPIMSTGQSLLQEDQRLALAQQVHAMRHALLRQKTNDGFPPYFVWSPKQGICTPLEEYMETKKAATTDETTEDTDDVIYCALDPYSGSAASTTDSKNSSVVDLNCGWPLRNLIAFLSFHGGLGGKSSVSVLSFRPGRLRRITTETDEATVALDQAHDQSVLWKITVPTKQDYGYVDDDQTDKSQNKFKVTGWELNPRGKPGPRSADLRPLLDPHHLAVQAADLNLKLMKWRMIPNLQVEKLQSTKVLILGAGTLGCNVARCLLGWGVRNFTFCDYGNVGYSNPVRQPLFTLADCQADNGKGVSKAVAAANALKEIAADVQATAHVVSIPMPGHAESKEQITESVTLLDQLVQDCDVVFLLTDTRESRWLPTVMAAAHNKLLMNAALGLDSWLVMRHGNGKGVGCYFCNDVVAPENSTKNRTLDQQCTVTRPGLAPIASSMAVELFVALLHHSKYVNAPAPKVQLSQFSPTVQSQGKDGDDEDNSSETPLGIVPHQVRGSLVSYTLMTPTVPAFVHCTGCAAAVIEAYQQDKMELVFQTCQPAGHEALENLSGLTEFRAQANAQLEAMEDDDAMWDDDEEE